MEKNYQTPEGEETFFTKNLDVNSIEDLYQNKGELNY